MEIYRYCVLTEDRYLVEKYNEQDELVDEHYVDLRGGRTLCDCKGFYYKKKACKHIKFILSQLQDKGGILDFQRKVWRKKMISEKRLKDAIHKVGNKIGINTKGKETEKGYDKKTAACWQCALLDELKIE